MTRFLLLGCLLATTSFSMAQESGGAKEAIALMSELTDVLKTVNNKATAEANLQKLKALDKKFVELSKATPKFSQEEEKLLAMRSSLLEVELNRINKNPDVKMVFKELMLFKEFAKSEIELAKVQIKTIDQAVAAFYLRQGEYPKSLKALTEGDTPLIKGAESLLDPWKKLYQYDVSGPKNKGVKPDIWTVTPNNVVVGNWNK